MRRRVGLALLAFAASACQRAEQPAARDSSRPRDTSASATTTTPPPLVVRPSGVGPLRVGMTSAEARRTLGLPARSAATPAQQCAYLDTEGKLPASVMIEHDTVVRFDVRDDRVATEVGARVGDTEAGVLGMYPGRVKVEPHKYTAPTGHYLVVSPPGDAAMRIIFETDGKRVTTYRAGRMPQVAYVEGCS